MARGFFSTYGANSKDPNFSKIGDFFQVGVDLYQWQVKKGVVVQIQVRKSLTLPLPMPRTAKRLIKR